MDRVTTCPPQRVVLKQLASERTRHPQQPAPGASRRAAVILDGEVEKFGDRALLDDQAAVHIGFAQPELGINEDAPLGRPARKSDRHGRVSAIPAAKGRSCRSRNLKVPSAEKPSADCLEQPIHRPPPSRQRLPPRRYGPRAGAASRL